MLRGSPSLPTATSPDEQKSLCYTIGMLTGDETRLLTQERPEGVAKLFTARREKPNRGRHP